MCAYAYFTSTRCRHHAPIDSCDWMWTVDRNHIKDAKRLVEHFRFCTIFERHCHYKSSLLVLQRICTSNCRKCSCIYLIGPRVSWFRHCYSCKVCKLCNVHNYCICYILANETDNHNALPNFPISIGCDNTGFLVDRKQLVIVFNSELRAFVIA